MTASPPADPQSMYRVSAKALVFDDDGKLLVFKDDAGEYEMPGGGWEYGELYEDCLKREFQDEVGIAVSWVGDIVCCWRDYADDARGSRLRLAAKAKLASLDFKPVGDDGEVLVEARFVTKEEFLTLPFQETEKGVLTCIDKIWS